MSDTPLYNALVRHKNLNRSSFHTPGHKSVPFALPQNLLSLDYTELPDTDSLFEASGAILQAEGLAAKLFGTARTLFSAGGCTLCIQAMLRLAAPNGGSVLCSRVIHRSAVNTMALLGITPVWAMPKDLLTSIEHQSSLKAVYVTSPNYYGELLNIPALAQACKSRGIPLLVDNAHGAHLFFTEPVLHPITLGAAMTSCSSHKTLNVLTGGAWLNIGDERYAADAKSAMALFASTSPSYPIMASLDLARAWLEDNASSAYPILQRQMLSLRGIAEEWHIPVLGTKPGTYDPTRLTLCTQKIGIPGEEAAQILRTSGVEPEMSDASHVVLIATPFNTKEDFARLAAALPLLAVHAGTPLPAHPTLPPLPPVCVPLRQAVLAPAEHVLLNSASGRIAAEAACPCPPGIPVTMPGERITPEAVEFLRAYGFFSIKVLK